MSGPEQPLVELEVGPVAHGGHCVARHEGRVVFVRHALPGERVRARLTDAGDDARFWRADAVEVLAASPDRVVPRCPLFHPGGCGGCDWQHADLAAQRRLKADVVREQLVRLGRWDAADPRLAALRVEPVPGDDDGYGWRTRVRFTVDPATGVTGLHPHRSHAIVPVEHCPIAHEQVDALGVGRRRWTGTAAVDVVTTPHERLVVVEPATGRAQVPPLGEASLARRGADGLQRLRGRTWVAERVSVDGEERTFRVSGSGFWQVHPGAAQTLLDAVLDAADPRPGERAVDLYAGVGLFTAGLAARVNAGGAEGNVLAVEGDERAGADARRNLHDLDGVHLETGRVERVLPALAASGELESADVVVLDPPRSGAGRAVLQAVLALRPRVVVYVACDPAALARDVATAADAGWRVASLRAFDLFPQTHHVECVASFVPDRP